MSRRRKVIFMLSPPIFLHSSNQQEISLLCAAEDADSIPSDVYILVRVYEMDAVTAEENGKGKEKDASKWSF
jgi:hypothetical protein